MHECRGQTFSASATGQEDLSLRSCKGICLHKENKQTVMNDLQWKVWTRCTQKLTSFKNIFWGFTAVTLKLHVCWHVTQCRLVVTDVSKALRSRGLDSPTTKNVIVFQSTCKDRNLLRLIRSQDQVPVWHSKLYDRDKSNVTVALDVI